MTDKTVERHYENVSYDLQKIDEYLARVLQLEAVACKDWLTNKVDRSVTGKVAWQQCQGVIQLPLSDCGVVALDYRGRKGIATALGHAPQAGLASPSAGSVLSVAESLTNIVWAPLREGLRSVSLSANWMWPCRSREGEDARLYQAVKALSDFCCELGINVPTGKDSLSLTQQYPDGEKVIAPGTVIVTSGGEVSDVRNVVSPVVINDKNSSLYYIDFSFDAQRLGGSAFAQSLGKVGDDVPKMDYGRTRYQCRRTDCHIVGNDFCQCKRRFTHQSSRFSRRRLREESLCRKPRNRYPSGRFAQARTAKLLRRKRNRICKNRLSDP